MPFRTPARAILSISLALLLGACHPASEPAAPTRTVLVQPAMPGSAQGNSFSGELRARHEADLAFRVGGKLLARLVDVGAEIKPGQALARLDPVDLELAANAAKAQLAAAESDLATTRADKERYADLLSRKFVSQAAYDARANAFSAAQARLEQAQSQSRISSNQANYGTLTAEFPAVVTAVLADAGQVIAAGQPVIRIARPEEKEIAVAIPENRMTEVRATKEFAVSLWADPKTVLKGQLRELAPAADPATRTYLARIRIPDAPADWRLGMTARVSLTGENAGPPVVPLGAVFDRGDGPTIQVVISGKVATRQVKIGQFRDDGVEIASGIQAGDQVVISGGARLMDGQPVQAKLAPVPNEQR